MAGKKASGCQKALPDCHKGLPREEGFTFSTWEKHSENRSNYSRQGDTVILNTAAKLSGESRTTWSLSRAQRAAKLSDNRVIPF